MSSGIGCDPNVAVEYSNLLDKKKYRYLILSLSSDLTKVVVDKIGDKDATFQDFLNDLPKDHIRYIFYDCEYSTVQDQKRSKVILVSWSSDDDAPLREKMLVSSTVKSVMNQCKGYAKATTINDYDELTEENFVNIVSDNRTK